MQLGYAMFCIILSFFFYFFAFLRDIICIVNDNIRKVRISQALWRTMWYFYTYFQLQKEHMFLAMMTLGPFRHFRCRTKVRLYSMLLLFAFSISSNIKKVYRDVIKISLKYNKLCAKLHQIVTIPHQNKHRSPNHLFKTTFKHKRWFLFLRIFGLHLKAIR